MWLEWLRNVLRPAKNVDILRIIVSVPAAAEKVRDVVSAFGTVFGGFVKLKNGFMLSDADAAEQFDLRVLMLSVRFSEAQV